MSDNDKLLFVRSKESIICGQVASQHRESVNRTLGIASPAGLDTYGDLIE